MRRPPGHSFAADHRPPEPLRPPPARRVSLSLQAVRLRRRRPWAPPAPPRRWVSGPTFGRVLPVGPW